MAQSNRMDLDPGSDVLQLRARIAELTRRAEEASTERQRFFAMLETLPVMVCVLKADYHVAFANRAFREKFGDSNGRQCYEYCWGYEPCAFCESLVPLQTGRPHQWEVISPDGNTFIEAYDVPFVDADGAPGVLEVDIDITERRKAEAALRESEDRYRAIVETAEEGIATHDEDGTITYVNQHMADMLGYSRGELIGRSSLDFVDAEEREEIIRARASLKAQSSFSKERKLRRKDGTALWTLVNVSPRRDGDGNFVGYLAMHTDITARKETQEALSKSEARLRLAQDAAGIGSFEWNLQTGVNTWTPRLEQMYGLPVGSFGRTQTAWENLLHPDDRAQTLERVKLAFETGAPGEAEFRVIWPDGSVHWLQGRWQVFKDASGAPLRLAGVNIDITDRKRAEEVLRQSEAQFRTLANAIPQLCWMANPDGWIFWYNQRWHEYTGTTPKQMEGWGWQSVHDPEMLPQVLERWRHSIATGETFEMVFPLRGADGVYRPFLTRVAPLRDVKGQVVRWFGTNTDISEQRRTEGALFAANQRLAALMEALPVGVSFSDDLSCEHIVGNPAALAQFEVTPEDNLSASAPDPAAPGRQVRFFRDGRAISDQELPLQRAVKYGRVIPPEELEVRLPSGRTWFAEASGAPFRDLSGNVVGGVAVTLDITERKQAEERLRQAQKMESIGILAGGIAHDFNNLLTGILGNASMMEMDAAPESREQLRAIIEASERSAALTRQLLAYAGKGQFRIEDFDVRRLIRSSVDLLRTSVPKNAEFAVNIPPSLPAVHGDTSQIQQVLMNLVINAAEALEGKGDGKVSVTAGVTDFEPAAAGGPRSKMAPGRYVWIAVEDNGCGMDEQTKEKIFEPFFTTKFTGRGLGLAAVHGILRSHKGAITVDSARGHGSLFTVYLPVSEQGASAPPIEGATKAGGRAATVLIVDDEEYVRRFTKVALERFGNRVLVAENGREALERLEQLPEIDMVVLDLVMPKLGGVEAFHEIRRRWPQLPILIASGYSQSEAARLGLPEDLTFLEKPYTVQALAAAVASALGASAAR